MKCNVFIISFLVGLLTACSVSASVFMPFKMAASSRSSSNWSSAVPDAKKARRELRRFLRGDNTGAVAMAIPGYGVGEQIVVGGLSNFLSLYNIIITARILLSWFPQAQGIGALQPVYAITDPFLNLFRGVIPPLFGLDFSPILAFFLLNVLTNATAAVGAEIPNGMMMPPSVLGASYHHKRPPRMARLPLFGKRLPVDDSSKERYY